MPTNSNNHHLLMKLELLDKVKNAMAVDRSGTAVLEELMI
jgi:hypothetical protein